MGRGERDVFSENSIERFPQELFDTAGRLGDRARLAFACVFAATLLVVQQNFANPNYIDNLSYFDRSPRANSIESVLRLDANDASFAAAAGWGGGYTSDSFLHVSEVRVNVATVLETSTLHLIGIDWFSFWTTTRLAHCDRSPKHY